ncbi:MAG: DUF1972 domain-containing protein, partial [Nitrososphaerota archaeon]|nr:DUF1972 domain-containing protein [Nitrososphaerota archaeon]
MRIAIIGVRGMPSSYGGLETFVAELAPRLVTRGQDVVVYCRKSLYQERPERFKGVGLRYLPSIEHKSFSTLSHSLLSIVDASFSNFDVVFVVNAANGFLGVFPKLTRKKSVLNVDGMEWLRPKWNKAAKWFFKTSARFGTKLYDVIVTDADEMHRLYAEEFGIKSKYIAYGANLENSVDPATLDKYKLRQGDYYLIASRLIPDNNADIIVEGFVKSGSRRYLAIAGGADYKGNSVEREFLEKLKRLANDRVVFLGHVNDPREVVELHCNAFAYVHGHQYGGINPALLKALGCGNLILANATPFNREVLAEGEYGVLFEQNAESVSAA